MQAIQRLAVDKPRHGHATALDKYPGQPALGQRVENGGGRQTRRLSAIVGGQLDTFDMGRQLLVTDA